MLEKKDDTLVIGIDNSTSVEGVTTDFVSVLFEADWATDDDVESIITIRNLLPTFITEYEALQRKADALAEAVEKMGVGDQRFTSPPDDYDRGWNKLNEHWRSQRDAALSKYREATKPSDV